MSATLQKRPSGTITSAAPALKTLNAEAVTVIATGFLKRIGHKGGLKPKRVSLEERIYTVEVEMKKLTATVRIDAETHEIKEYEIQTKGEEAPFIAVSPKIIIVMFGISAAAFVVLHFAFGLLGL